MGENTLLKIKQDIEADKMNGKKKYSVFGALGDPSRFLIFKILLNQQEVLCVSDVARVLDVSISAASQQLKILELHGLVTRDRKGQKICYKIKRNDPVVQSLIDIVHI